MKRWKKQKTHEKNIKWAIRTKINAFKVIVIEVGWKLSLLINNTVACDFRYASGFVDVTIDIAQCIPRPIHKLLSDSREKGSKALYECAMCNAY